MVTYLPWSEQNLKSALEAYKEGDMPILDLELSAVCEHRLACGGCIYCDSSTGP